MGGTTGEGGGSKKIFPWSLSREGKLTEEKVMTRGCEKRSLSKRGMVGEKEVNIGGGTT